MTYRDVSILVPSHSLEDFPTDLGDRPASSLLNAFAVAWHPLLLQKVGGIPLWHRADDPPQDNFSGRLFLVPTACDDRVPHGWMDRARSEGAVVVSGLIDREPMQREALALVIPPVVDTATAAQTVDGTTAAQAAGDAASDETSVKGAAPAPESAAPMPADSTQAESKAGDADIVSALPANVAAPSAELDPEIVRDFQSLGICWLMMELLTRHMHHFTSYDEVFFQKTVVAAAEAAVRGEVDVARERLRSCFDLLTEARERFYPVDCYLLDLCLLTPEQVRESKDALSALLRGTRPVNLLLKATDAEIICGDNAETRRLLKEAWARGSVDVVGGDYREQPVPLVPLASVIHDLQRGRAAFRKLLGHEPSTWGRKRFGHCVLSPQLLTKTGFHSALHFLLDDGIYPDREVSRMRWEGCDNSGLDSISRIPLAADSASAWLRFPQRMAEAMESDQVAAVILARWPQTQCPIFEDMLRIASYAPVLGRFVTFNEYFMHTDTPGGAWHSDTREYLSPFLVQSVARREKNPISRFRDHAARTSQFETALWQDGLASALFGQPVRDDAISAMQDKLDIAGPDAFSESTALQIVDDAAQQLADFGIQAAQRLSQVVMHGAGNETGWLCFNPLSFTRRVIVDLPVGSAVPEMAGPVRMVHQHESRVSALVEIPAAGFAWFPAKAGRPESGVVLATANHLQNEFFEVLINPESGGLAQVKKHGRSPNRLSQQLALRYPRELTVREQHGDEVRESKTWYSVMRGLSSEVTCAGPGMGEVVTTGELLDPMTKQKLAGFRQSFRVWRGLPILEIETEFDIQRAVSGDPWTNYYGARFAWNAHDAALSQSVLGTAQPINGQRIEAPDFIEIAAGDERTTLLPMGLPFHRSTGPKMLDSLFVVDGETQRRFTMRVAIDQYYPMQTALDQVSKIVPIATQSGPPRSGTTGWFYHLDSKCVQVTRISGLLPEPYDGDEAGWETSEPAAPPTEAGFALRMQETEGRYQSVYVELFRAPTRARLRDFRGGTLNTLEPVRDGVRVDFGPFSIVELEVRFE